MNDKNIWAGDNDEENVWTEGDVETGDFGDLGEMDFDAEELNAYADAYSDGNFWDKLFKYALKIGRTLVEEALVLYYALQDKSLPPWAKASIIGALGYLISPIDLIPDVLPVVGYTDDAGVIAAVLLLIKNYVKDEHRERARAKIAEFFGEEED